MSDKRELTRAEMRRQRAIARDVVLQRMNAICERLEIIVAKVRMVLIDKTFREILRSEGVHSIPRILSANTPVGVEGDSLDRSLEFVVAWTLLYPMFNKPEIATHLDKAWPGFILQMKDTFIAIVVEGPFPHSLSGHRGRRRGANYNPSAHRHSLLRRRAIGISVPHPVGMPVLTKPD